MWPYVLNVLAAAVIPLFLAGYGGHLATLALHSKREKRTAIAIVWCGAGSGVLLFAILQVVLYRADAEKNRSDQTFRMIMTNGIQTIISESDPKKRIEEGQRLQTFVASSMDSVTASLAQLKQTEKAKLQPAPALPSPKAVNGTGVQAMTSDSCDSQYMQTGTYSTITGALNVNGPGQVEIVYPAGDRYSGPLITAICRAHWSVTRDVHWTGNYPPGYTLLTDDPNNLDPASNRLTLAVNKTLKMQVLAKKNFPDSYLPNVPVIVINQKLQ